MTSARVLAVCLGPGGIPKQPVEGAQVGELGLEGDGHRFRFHGGAHRAVCLFSTADYASLQRDGVACDAPGTFGENLLIEGLDFEALAPGMRLAVGEELLLEIADVREPCKTLKQVDGRFPALMEGRSGFLCRVLRTGWVQPGQGVQPIS
ncbi:MAG: MOSC domain-containing protein [Planctomycetota bacterium]